ncbi:MAG: type IV pilus modification PilV family protein [Candidatus Oxydemutatoraceae bacterium WSBS_2016_MAG_OTU14]
MNNCPASRGFALLEVLLAFVLVGVGLVAGLRLLTHNANLQNHLSQATLAQVISTDLMRKMDALNISPHHFAIAYDAFPSAPNCWRQSCSKQELAKFFVARWKCHLSAWHKATVCQKTEGRLLLPASRGQIEVSDELVNIRLSWNQKTPGAQTIQLNYVPFP